MKSPSYDDPCLNIVQQKNRNNKKQIKNKKQGLWMEWNNHNKFRTQKEKSIILYI